DVISTTFGPSPMETPESAAVSLVPPRSTPKYFSCRGRVEPSTRASRSAGGEGRPSGSVTSSPWMTSWLRAPACPPPGGCQGWSILRRRRPTSSASLIVAAADRASRSAYRSNENRARTRPPITVSGFVRNGIVMCATTSRTRHPSQRDAASHCSGVRSPKSPASRSRSARVSLTRSAVGVPMGSSFHVVVLFTDLYDVPRPNSSLHNAPHRADPGSPIRTPPRVLNASGPRSHGGSHRAGEGLREAELGEPVLRAEEGDHPGDPPVQHADRHEGEGTQNTVVAGPVLPEPRLAVDAAGDQPGARAGAAVPDERGDLPCARDPPRE